MSEIVLVHGIAQSGKSADTLEAQWVPDVAGGLRNSGHDDLADRVRQGDITVRMAFYGDLFRDAGAQGAAPGPTGGVAAQIEDELAVAWLESAAERASDPHDRAIANRGLAQLKVAAGAQGKGALGRAAIGHLSNIAWLAPYGFAFAATFIKQSLREVSAYLTDPSIRQTAQDRVRALVDDSTRVVLAHSLGSVVAYEALHQVQQPLTLVTIGSPLGLRTIIYQRLTPQPPRVPECVTRWVDFADREDIIAVHTNLAQDYPASAKGVTLTPTISVTNGAKPHNSTAYVVERRLGQVLADSLQW